MLFGQGFFQGSDLLIFLSHGFGRFLSFLLDLLRSFLGLFEYLFGLVQLGLGAALLIDEFIIDRFLDDDFILFQAASQFKGHAHFKGAKHV